MHDKGSHGDGAPQNTQTPLLCWGAGVAGPHPQQFLPLQPHPHAAYTRSDSRWALDHLARHDVHQADVCPLMVRGISLCAMAFI